MFIEERVVIQIRYSFENLIYICNFEHIVMDMVSGKDPFQSQCKIYKFTRFLLKPSKHSVKSNISFYMNNYIFMNGH